MNIVFVSTRSDTIGGSNIHIRDVAQRMMELGHEVTVLGGQEGVFYEDLLSRGIPYRPLKHLVRNVSPLRDSAAVLEMRSVFATLQPDLISLHTAKAGTVGRLARYRSTPIVYTPHGWPFATGVNPKQARIYAAVERVMARRAGAIVNVCEADQQEAFRHGVGVPGQHVVIHNGMPDVSEALHARPEQEPAKLTMIARFEEQKDHETLFKGLAHCLDQVWTIDLIGDGPLEASARRLAASLGLEKRVNFLGLRQNISELLSKTQIYLLISRWEGFPRSIIEAMRAGLPIVASDVGGVAEAVRSDRNGFTVPAGNAQAVGRALRTLLDNPGLRHEYGRTSRQLYEHSFTFESMFSKTLALYGTLVKESELG